MSFEVEGRKMDYEYINREDAIRRFELSIKSWIADRNSNAPTMVRAYEEAVYRLKNIPAADVAEVRHGKWKRRGNEKTCSECKFIYYSNNDEWNYCPNCGAKMDGKGDSEL